MAVVHPLPYRSVALAVLAILPWLSGCDALGIETPGKVAEKKEEEGKAIGAACRHALRSIEDCHASNPKASKAAIFTGWREMDTYMRENDIQGMPAKPVSPAESVSPGEEVAPKTEAGKAAPATAKPAGGKT